jgi:hypothetical protein
MPSDLGRLALPLSEVAANIWTGPVMDSSCSIWNRMLHAAA